MHIAEIDIAYFGVLVPPEHAVNGFCQFGATALIDAASIDLRIFQPIILRLLTIFRDLHPSFLCDSVATIHIFE